MIAATVRSRLLAAVLTAPLMGGCGAGYRVPPPPTAAEIPGLEARVAANASDVQASVRLAQAYRANSRLADARALLERTVERHPGEAVPAVLLGLTYEDLEMFAEARQFYRTYIEHGSSAELRNELSRRLPLLQRRELQATVRNALARERELANTPPRPYTIAVFPYQYVGADDDMRPLGRALAELLVTDLSQTSRLQVLERAQVQMLLDEMRLTATGRVDPETAARTGRILGAERIVHGSLDGSQAALQMETTIFRVTENAWPGEAGATRTLQLSEADRLQQLIAMQKRLALRIYSSLGVQLTATERERVTRQPTENILALVAFGRGLEAEDGGDFTTAARHFAEAARIDPGFAAARQSAERVQATAAAAAVNTQQLASRAEAETSIAAAPAANEFFLPNPMVRDPAAEVLRTEGVASPTIIEIVIPRPRSN